MAAPSAPLNAEPANPVERKENHLPPKSYADAVEEESPVNGADGAADRNGTNGTGGRNAVKGGKSANAIEETKHKAPVLRIVDTGAPDAKEKQEERPQVERQESKQEYTATVSSDSP